MIFRRPLYRRVGSVVLPHTRFRECSGCFQMFFERQKPRASPHGGTHGQFGTGAADNGFPPPRQAVWRKPRTRFAPRQRFCANTNPHAAKRPSEKPVSKFFRRPQNGITACAPPYSAVRRSRNASRVSRFFKKRDSSESAPWYTPRLNSITSSIGAQ